MTYEREMTAPMTAVGAVVGQSLNITTNIISENEGFFNPSDEEIFLAQQEYKQEMQARAHKILLIDGRSAVESVFALLLPRVTEANSALPNFSELRSVSVPQTFSSENSPLMRLIR